MKRPLRWYEFLTVNAYWLGINTGSAVLTPVLLPFLVALFMPAAQKNSYLATVRVIGLAVAMLVQPLAGLLSDRNTSRWGRRRPFIATGALFNIVFLFIIGASPAFMGAASSGVSRAYLVLIVGLALFQVSANVAQGALQGLIPDVVPENQRGRASGVKSVFELLPIFVVILIGPLVEAGKIWPVIGITMATFAITAAITVLGVRETPLREKPAGSLFEPTLRLVALTAIFVGTTQAVIWLVTASGRWLREGGAGVTAQVALIGLAGLIGMAGAIFVGVYAGAWVGIGAEARQQKSFIWWVINRLLFLAAVGSIQGFAQYYLRDFLGIANAVSMTTLLLGVVALFLLPAALGGGFLADRVGRKRLVAAAGLIAAAGTGTAPAGAEHAAGAGQRERHRPGDGPLHGGQLGAGNRSGAEGAGREIPGHLQPGRRGRRHRRRGHRRTAGRFVQRVAARAGLPGDLCNLRRAVPAVGSGAWAGACHEWNEGIASVGQPACRSRLPAAFRDRAGPPPARTQRDPARVLGQGRVCTVFGLCDDPQSPVFKRLAVFRSDEDAIRYEALHRKYVRALGERARVRVLPCTTMRVRDASGTRVVVYIIQEQAQEDSIGHQAIYRMCTTPDIDHLVTLILRETAKVFDLNAAHQGGQEIGFDARISNWVIQGFDPENPCLTERMRLAYLDTTTPLMRNRGQEQFDIQPFVRGMPALLPMFLRRSALKDLIARYYDFRGAVVDLLSNLHAEGRPELVPWLTGTANWYFLAERAETHFRPLTVAEVAAHHRREALSWRAYLAVRRLTRKLRL